MIQTIMNFVFLAAVFFIIGYILWYGISIHFGEQIHIELYGLSKHFKS